MGRGRNELIGNRSMRQRGSGRGCEKGRKRTDWGGWRFGKWLTLSGTMGTRTRDKGRRDG